MTATGIVLAHVICDSLRVGISLESYDTQLDAWYTVESWDVTEENTAMLVKSFTVSVDKGHYYRTRGIHIAQKGDTTEQVTTLTDGILIN